MNNSFEIAKKYFDPTKFTGDPESYNKVLSKQKELEEDIEKLIYAQLKDRNEEIDYMSRLLKENTPEHFEDKLNTLLES